MKLVNDRSVAWNKSYGIYLGVFTDCQTIKLGQTSCSFCGRFNQINKNTINKCICQWCLPIKPLSSEKTYWDYVYLEALECLLRNMVYSIAAISKGMYIHYMGDRIEGTEEAILNFFQEWQNSQEETEKYFKEKAEIIRKIMEETDKEIFQPMNEHQIVEYLVRKCENIYKPQDSEYLNRTIHKLQRVRTR